MERLFFNIISKEKFYLIEGNEGFKDWFWNEFYKDNQKAIEYSNKFGTWDFEGYLMYIIEMLKGYRNVRVIELQNNISNVENTKIDNSKKQGLCCREKKE